jgi:ComF family protein
VQKMGIEWQVKQMLWRWVEVGMNMLFPQAPRCAACQGPLEREGVCLCSSCVGALPLIRGPVCVKCGGPLPCVGCAGNWAFTGLRALGLYQGPLQEMIHQVKYEGNRELGLALGELLAGPVREEEVLRSCSVIAWVPLHPNRMARRGFDQAELLARGLARQLGRRLLPRWTLIRWRDTPSQTKLDRLERLRNVDGAFRVEYPQLVRGKAVLLVDDVLTTGATCHAAAAALLAAGALRVGVCVVALSHRPRRGGRCN